MQKIKPFHISATKNGPAALIRITGVIGIEYHAEKFRKEVDDLVKQGIKDAHIYINSEGGSCFQAAEIVNILSDFTGKVTGEGGALVASAATFIALHCDSFVMPANGMFMIHKPTGGASGTANDIAAYLKLLTDIEKQYFEKYHTRAARKEEFIKQWNAGDWWLTSREALENGFISSLKNQISIDKETAASIAACGCPDSKIPIINKISENMDLKAMAQAVGLPDTASEAEVRAAIEAGQKAQTDLKKIKEETEKKELEELSAKIESDVQKAIDSKRITADMGPKWKKALTENYDTNIELLEALLPVAKIPTHTGNIAGKGEKVTYKGKTFEELQEENPDVLAALEKENRAAYDDLFNDYVKRNNLQ